MKIKSIVAMVLAGMLLAGNAVAGRSHEVTTQAWVVGTYISEEGETRDAFITRVAGVIHTWTMANNAEVCGYLATDGTRWGVKLTTQKSQIMCISDVRMVPNGLVASKDNIHSHPSAGEHGTMKVTMETKRMARMLRENSDRRQIRPKHGFSKDDFANGSGYLVADGRLLYQNGKGTERDLGGVGDNPALVAAK